MGEWSFSPSLDEHITTAYTNGKLTITVPPNVFTSDKEYTVTYDDGNGCTANAKFRISSDCSSPGPSPDCDGRITISYNGTSGSANVNCSTTVMQLEAETEPTTDCVSGIWREENPCGPEGSTSEVQIAKINGQYTGTWTFTCEDKIVKSSEIVARGQAIYAPINPNTSSEVRYQNVSAVSSDGCNDAFSIHQAGAGSTCDGRITISYNGTPGSTNVNCNTTEMQLTATTNNQ